MRAFLAFDLDEESKKKIKKIISSNFKDLKKFNQLKEKRKLKEVKSNQYHITFLFFAQLSEKNLKIIEKLFKEIEFEEFEVEIKKVSYFKTGKKIRVIFLEFENNLLNKLFEKYKEVFKALDLSSDELKQLKNPKIHLTLFRLRNPVEEKVLKDEIVILTQKFKGLRIKINDFCLFKSTLYPTGPFYEKIFSKKGG